MSVTIKSTALLLMLVAWELSIAVVNVSANRAVRNKQCVSIPLVSVIKLIVATFLSLFEQFKEVVQFAETLHSLTLIIQLLLEEWLVI